MRKGKNTERKVFSKENVSRTTNKVNTPKGKLTVNKMGEDKDIL
jgi:hypothetical protein